MAANNATATEIFVAIVGGNINGSDNITFSHGGGQETNDMGYVDLIERIISPMVCLVGTVLNLLSVGTFLSRPLKRISCCLYLATRSLAVFGFLVSVITALTRLMNTEGICELTVFLSYFCPFISVWMVVIISIENFIRIAQPSRVGNLCTPRVAKYLIVGCVVVGLIVYNVFVWTSRVINGTCQVLAEFYELVLVINYIDAALTLFCPFIVMLIVVPLVGLTAISAFERKKRLSNRTDAATGNRQQPSESKSSPESKVTRLLFAVSLVFLLLHAPFHTIRIKVFILSLTDTFPTRTDAIIMHVFRLIYNLDTCASCAVYLIFGDNFRRVFLTSTSPAVGPPLLMLLYRETMYHAPEVMDRLRLIY